MQEGYHGGRKKTGKWWPVNNHTRYIGIGDISWFGFYAYIALSG
jgi:hypothetical protein